MSMEIQSQDSMSSWQRPPEISAQLACQYTQGMFAGVRWRDAGPDPLLIDLVFFQHAIETTCEILDQSWFENKLQMYHANGTASDDSSWYALRNIVYAFGCRIHMNLTASYTRAVGASMVFFQNALSVELDLLHRRTSLMGVQALAVMVRS